VTNRISALVIDDHPLSASGIADFLLSHCGFDAARAVSSVAEFWDILDADRPPSLAVVDFWLPEGASLGLLEELKRRCRATRLLIISADDNTAVLDKSKMAGADGFLHKQETPDVFAEAVAALLQGGSWFQRGEQFAGRQFPSKELSVTARELGLTIRQGQVLAMMLKGLPNKRIALNLSVSEQTVKEHVTGILERLGARNRIEVITMLRGRRLE